ncbi:MAG: DUF3073 domain-containing protein [Dermatophilaceae bacterium]
MGRGRAKAKQTKVARELKYYSPSTDLSALERELHSASASGGYARTNDDVDDDEGDDDYDEYAEESAALDEDDDPDTVYDEYGKWASGPR